jgi:hypothetical protein
MEGQAMLPHLIVDTLLKLKLIPPEVPSHGNIKIAVVDPYLPEGSPPPVNECFAVLSQTRPQPKALQVLNAVLVGIVEEEQVSGLVTHKSQFPDLVQVGQVDTGLDGIQRMGQGQAKSLPQPRQLGRNFCRLVLCPGVGARQE